MPLKKNWQCIVAFNDTMFISSSEAPNIDVPNSVLRYGFFMFRPNLPSTHAKVREVMF